MKVNNYSILALNVIICLFSCRPKDEKEIFFNKFPRSSEIFSRTIYLKDILGRPLQLFVRDSLLIVNEVRDDFLISIYNLNNGTLLKKECRVGMGPNEFLPPLDVLFSSSKDSLNIFERSIFMYSESTLDDSLRLQVSSGKRKFDSSTQKIYKLKDGLFLVVGVYEKGRFGLLDLITDNVFYSADFPDVRYGGNFRMGDVPDDVKAMIFQSKIGIKPDKQRFVVANNFCGILEVYRINHADVEKIAEQRIDYSIDLKSISSGNMLRAAFLDSNHRGYTDLFVSENFIYALYSGRTKKDFPGSNGLGNWILVFDWDGNPVFRYTLDVPIRYFSINSNNGILYGISDQDSVIYEFDLEQEEI